jgi:hypothetical protein
MSLLLSLFLKITQREFSNEYMRFLNLRHSDTLLVCVSSPWLNNYSFCSYHLKANMWSSRIDKKIVTYVIHIAKLRDGSKRVMKFFSNQFREMLKMEREREWTHPKDLKLKYFSPLYRYSSLYYESLLSSFLSPFFNTFSLIFSAPSVYFGIFTIFEEKTNLKFFFVRDGSGYTMNMKVGEL